MVLKESSELIGHLTGTQFIMYLLSLRFIMYLRILTTWLLTCLCYNWQSQTSVVVRLNANDYEIPMLCYVRGCVEVTIEVGGRR